MRFSGCLSPPLLGAFSGMGGIWSALGAARLVLGPLLKLPKPLDLSPAEKVLLRAMRSVAIVALLGAGVLVLGLDMVLLREMVGVLGEESSALPAIRSRKLEGTLIVVWARARLAAGLGTVSASPSMCPSVSSYIK
jgi:hypothetical protein